MSAESRMARRRRSLAEAQRTFDEFSARKQAELRMGIKRAEEEAERQYGAWWYDLEWFRY